MTKTATILGCGPAGLMAAHAAAISGWNFRILSKKLPSQLYGAQYLHKPIPNLECGVPKIVKYELHGTPEQYREKVYGSGWDGTVSPEDLAETHDAWDIRAAYRDLWELYSNYITNVEFSPPGDGEYSVSNVIAVEAPDSDLVISTIPRTVFYKEGNGDEYSFTVVWAIGDTFETNRVPIRLPEFTVRCNGNRAVPWYRVANIFGYSTMEWTYTAGRWDAEGNFYPPRKGASAVIKPLYYHGGPSYHYLGRYGKFEKGVLSHEAFFDAMQIFAKDSIDATQR